MSHPTESRTRLGAVRSYPGDLAAVSVFAILIDVFVTMLPTGSDLRLLLALPLVTILPGYALVAMLFPANARATHQRAADETGGRPGGIDVVERFGLSFVTSFAIVPVITMALAVTRWGLTPRSASISLGLFTVGFAQLAAIRRLRLPEPDRYEFSVRDGVSRLRHSADQGVLASVSTILLVACVATALGVTGYALVAPQDPGGFTELALYTEDEDGELVADDYPSELGPEESATLVLTVENQHNEFKDYEVVVQQQRLEDGEVVERTELDRFDPNVESGETARIDHTLEPSAEGETVRIVYLLYDGAVPEEPTIDNADEDVFVWTTVTDASDESE